MLGFKENPVKKLCGEDCPLPTTTQLVKKQGFTYVGRLFSELGVGVGRGGTRLEKFFQGSSCPVPIFQVGRNFFYPQDQEEALKAFVNGKLKQLD